VLLLFITVALASCPVDITEYEVIACLVQQPLRGLAPAYIADSRGCRGVYGQ